MFEVRSEAHGRVLSAVEDIKSCCEIGDYYKNGAMLPPRQSKRFLKICPPNSLTILAERSEITFQKLPRKIQILQMVLRKLLRYALMKCLTT